MGDTQTAEYPTVRESPGRLLLVDDSVLTIDVVSELMRDHGWDVATADTGAEALRRVAELLPEVVVCDLNMPDLDGLEVSRRIHEIDPSIPVIMLSSEDRVESVLASMHAGVFDFVQKKNCVHTLPGAATRAAAHCRVMRENRRLNEHLLEINEALEQRVEEQTALLQEKMRRAAALETAAAVAPLKKELEIAQHIQTSILPRSFEVSGLEIRAHMVPAAVVGGDYYDVRPQPDGCWIGIGDVSGHGLTAGLLMMMIQSGISALTLARPDALPHEVLPHLNRMLWENIRERLGRDDFATLCLLRYFSDGRLLHAGAHEDILVCPAAGGPCQRIAAPGTWLGGVRDIARVTTTHTIQLAPADTVVLFTDGITEARASDRTFYGLDRLCELLERHRALPVADLHDVLLRDVQGFTPVADDDMTLLVMRHQAAPTPTLNSRT
jgi:serine phosphatase RsbU (regulator of sigma subunit)